MSRTTYVTQLGDMWDLIAYRLTGSTDQVEKIMQANPKYIDTYIFSAGIELQIPELNNTIDYDSVPPWKRE